jgi:type IV secretion system protein VirB9
VYLSNTGKRWPYHTSITKRDLFIEARMPGLRNAATVITSVRRYELDLRSSDSGRVNHRVSWHYSGDDAAGSGARASPFGTELGTEYAANAPAGARGPVGGSNGAGAGSLRVDLAHANFDYDIQGDTPFRPTMVFDDGRFTYVQLPHNARLPAVMVRADPEGHEDHGAPRTTTLQSARSACCSPARA